MPGHVLVHRYRQRRSTPISESRLKAWPVRDLSRTDHEKIGVLIDEIRGGERSGYTYTSIFRFDIDDPKTLHRTYDRLGDRVMYVIAKTNRRLDDLRLSDVVLGPRYGLGFWRSDDGTVYADDIKLFFDIGDEAALAQARENRQYSILKVDGRSRSFEFLETGA